MDSETRGLLRDSLREVVTGDPDKIVTALGELGWSEVVADDPAEAITLLFTEHGRALGRARILDGIVLDAVAAGAAPRCDAVLYPAVGARSAGSVVPAASPESVEGVLLGPVDPAGQVLVAVADAGGSVRLAAVPGAALATSPLAGFDPDRGLLRAHLADPGALPVTAAGRAGGAGGADQSAAWSDAVAAGRRALVAEIAGVSRAALALAVEHTTSRRQFGQSIAAFQSVRHRLAEVHVAITAAETLLATAWTARAAQPGEPAEAVAARAAYAQAGRTSTVVARHTVQVCGAMGAAEEFGLHRLLARSAVLSTLLGGYPATAAGIGADLLATGTAPRLTMIRSSRLVS